MPRAQYADILRQRREQLGLTIPQAASVLRLRESVVESFEAGDFDHLPPLGYAQGMVSSYARYLGLDPARLSDLYEHEHAEYVAFATGSAPSGLASLRDEPGGSMPLSGAMRRTNTGRVREGGVRAAADPGAGLDPVAASRARVGQAPLGSSQASGRSQGSRIHSGQTQGTSSRSMRPTNLPQRYNSSPGYGVEGSFSATQSGEAARYASDRRYTSQMGYGHTAQDPNFEEGYERSGRRYTSRRPEQADGRTRKSQADRVRRSRATEDAYTERFEHPGSFDQPRSSIYADSYLDEIETRRVNAQYRDDLHYGSDARAYRASNTREGREGARNMQMPGRIENARRRNSDASSSRTARGARRNTQPQQSGFAGALQAYFADPQRAILSIGVLLALILLLILVFGVRSCVEASSGSGKQVSVVTTLAATTEAPATTTSAEEQAIIDAAASEKAASAEAAAYTETIVKVSVADGATTWVEISCDGEQKVAESVTGAWSQEFVVTQQIQIQVVDPSSVTVEKNGEVQAFSSKSAGLSSITIEGTDPAAAAAATAAATDESSDDSSDDGDYSDDEYYSGEE